MVQFSTCITNHRSALKQTIKEETISLLLQLVEDELKSDTKDDSPVLKSSGDLLPAHVSACVLALSGWTAG